MITSNFTIRTMCLRSGGGTATLFVIERNERQYIVTAKHCVSNLRKHDSIEIFHDEKWLSLDVKVVGHSDGDISVLTLDELIVDPEFEIDVGVGGLMLSQDVYFLGFPYGFTGYSGEFTRNFPMPFIKKGIVSSMSDWTAPVVIDAHNNPGFSGGPVIFKNMVTNRFQIGLVVSGYLSLDEPVSLNGNENEDLTWSYNTGLMHTYSIKYALDVIDANPIGCQIF